MGTRMRRSDARKPTKPKAVLLIPMCAKGGGEMAWGCYFGGVDQGGGQASKCRLVPVWPVVMGPRRSDWPVDLEEPGLRVASQARQSRYL